MRVLVLAPFDRGESFGGAMRATAVAERLEERGAVVEWATTRASEVSRAAKVRAAGILRPSLVLPYGGRPPLAHGRWDAVIAAHSYLFDALADLRSAGPLVVDFHNLEWRHLLGVAKLSAPPRNLHLGIQAMLMRRHERRVVRSTDLALFVSEQELAWGRKASARAELLLVRHVLPRAPERVAELLAERRASRRPVPTLAYVGKLDFPPNVLSLLAFLDHTWPAVVAANPAVRLVVAGESRAADARALQAHANVEYVGYVEDLTPILEGAAAAILPFDSRAGSSMRVLFYALAGVPIIGSEAAFRGFARPLGAVARSRADWVRLVGEALAAAGGRQRVPAEARADAIALQSDPTAWDELYGRLEQAVSTKSTREMVAT